MEYFNQVILDNTIGQYLIIIGIIFIIRIFRKYLSKPLAAGLYHSSKRLGKMIDKKQFIEMIARPLGQLISILSGITAISYLHYPESWNFSVFELSFHLILNKCVLLIIIVSITRFIIKLITFSALLMERKDNTQLPYKEDQLIIFSRDLLKIIVIITALMIMLRFVFERQLGTILTGLSIVGAALALAAKETIENLIASFIIFFDKPFTAGDQVKVNSIIGQIEHIGLRSTRIRTVEKTIVSVPNKQMVDSQVDNWSNRTERRAEVKLDLHVSTSVEKTTLLLNELKSILSAKSELLRHSVFFSDFSKAGKTLTIEYFTPAISMDEFSSIKENILTEVTSAVEKVGVELTSGGSSVTVIRESGITGGGSSGII